MSVFIQLQDYKSILDNEEPHLLLDVRPLVEVDICHLPVSLSILLLLQPHNSFYFVMILS